VGDDADLAVMVNDLDESSMKGTMVSRTQLRQQRSVSRQQAHEGLASAAAR
jgi:hypothetical protein